MANSRRTTTSIVKEPTFWQRRTLLEKTLITLCILAFIAIVALAISVSVLKRVHSKDKRTVYSEALTLNSTKDHVKATSTELPEGIVTVTAEHITDESIVAKQWSNLKQETKNENEDKTCVTPGCIRATAKIYDRIDESVDPCENFYEFACGNYVHKTFIPDDKSSVDSFSFLRDQVQEQLRTIINEDADPNESKPFFLAKNLNKACLNKTIIEQRGIKPLADLLESFGGWPVVKGDLWNEHGFDWIETIRRFRRMGLDTNIIFSFTVLPDFMNSTKRVLDIDQTGLGLSREYLIKGLDEKFVKAYYTFMVDNAVILGASQKQAEKEFKDTLEFETKLANISLPNEKRRNASALYNPFTIKELQEKYPYIQWLDYINALLPEGLDVDENEKVINNVPTFFEQLGNVLGNTTKRTVANYFLWRVVSLTSGTLTSQLRKRKLAYFTTLYGQQDEEPRWKECVSYTAASLPISVGALYVRKFFDEESRRAAIELVENVREQFIDILHEISWMDDETRDAAIDKAKALTEHIGYPNELADNKKLEEHYRELELEPDNLLMNLLRLNVFDTNYSFNKLRKPVNKTDWVTHSKPALVNAFYSSLENSIQFPAAILQGHFFSADRPHFMNYAAIGQIIGHEITHGFDDRGRQFDLNGNLVDWWTPDVQTQFLEKAQCIIDQYGNFTDAKTNLSLNGINTQGENIADNGGLKEAYLAYKKWTQRNGNEQQLPGLRYSPEQLFWIWGAQTWCAVDRPAYSKNKIVTGMHSPNEFRVIGPLNNMKEFAEDFNCPEGTRMNPTKKCNVW